MSGNDREANAACTLAGSWGEGTLTTLTLIFGLASVNAANAASRDADQPGRVSGSQTVSVAVSVPVLPLLLLLLLQAAIARAKAAPAPSRSAPRRGIQRSNLGSPSTCSQPDRSGAGRQEADARIAGGSNGLSGRGFILSSYH